jgi:hypothetical protein
MMCPQMQIIRIDVEVENPVMPVMKVTLRNVLVDPGAELSWFPANVLEALEVERKKTREFIQTNGASISRSTGALSLFIGKTWTVDEVVFAEPADMYILGARSLMGLNMRLNTDSRRLVGCGPGHVGFGP